MSEVKEIKQSINKGTCVGTLSEKDYEIVDAQLTDGTPCKAIKGNVVVTNDSGTFKFGFYINNTTKKHTENRMYKGIETAMKEYETGELIAINYRLRINDYENQRGTLSKSVNYDVQNMSRHKATDEPEVMEGKLSGMIHNIAPEIVGEDETGRLKVEIVGVTYGQDAEPYDMFVENDMVDAFNDIYDVGDVAIFDYEVVSVHYGGATTTQTTAFGRKAKVASGFDRTEMRIIGGEAPFEEEREEYFTMEDLKPLLDNREIKLENISKGKKTTTKKSGLKSKKTDKEFVATPLNDDELPF
jgi:hypothetical protein